MDRFVTRTRAATEAGAPGSSDVRSCLRTVFRLDAFRGPQQAVIDHALAGHDALVLMPTGAGKSLTFQLPAVLSPGVTLVVSPLLALMAIPI